MIIVNNRKRKKVKSLSCVRLFVIPWTVAYQVRQSMGFSSNNTRVGCHYNGCIIYRKIVERVNPKCSHHKEIFSSFSFDCICFDSSEMMNAN